MKTGSQYYSILWKPNGYDGHIWVQGMLRQGMTRFDDAVVEVLYDSLSLNPLQNGMIEVMRECNRALHVLVRKSDHGKQGQ